jgi:hypothetical protein
MTSSNPADALLNRLTNLFGERLPPRPQLEDAIARFMAGLDLVPRHELELHISTLKTLKERIADLEARVDELERSSGD